MNSRSTSMLALVSAVLMAVLYFLGMQDPELPEVTPAPTAATPAPTPRPAPAATPAPAPRATPAPTAAAEEATPEEDIYPPIEVHGAVTTDDGDPVPGVRVYLVAGAKTLREDSDEDGRFDFGRTDGGIVKIYGQRRDGRFTSRSETQTLDGTRGGVFEVALKVGVGTIGGIGVRLEKHEAGAWIRALEDGGPAHRAGLKPNEVIIEVGEEIIEGFSLRAIGDLIKGEEGTSVEVAVRSPDGSERTVTLKREYADRRWGRTIR